MFYLTAGEYISGNCGTNNAINLSLIGQGDISVGEQTSTANLIQPLTSSLQVVFTAVEPTQITHILFTNVTGSTVTGINLYLNGRKVVSNIVIKANTTVTLHSGGFTQYPVEVATGGGGSSTWGGITGTITDQTDLFDTFQKKVLSLTAGESISSGMAVVIWTDNKVYKYDISNVNHAGLTCGIAKTSGILDNLMDVVLPGNIHVEVGSGWSVGNSYYISATSILTTTAPTTGIIKKIGTGIDTDTIFINDYNEFITI